MAINWGELKFLRNQGEVRSRLKELIRADNYGPGRDNWSLTELFAERSAAALYARRMIQGVGTDGRSFAEGPMTAADGSAFAVKLKVLSRQACKRTKDGTPINTWDTTSTETPNWNGEICPDIKDAPEEGDEVWVKGDPITHDEVTGERLTKNRKQALKARYEAEAGHEIKMDEAVHYYRKYPVGADGTITVSYNDACQLLSNNGKRLVFPQFTTSNKGARQAQGRRITNWLFEETFPTPATQKKR